MSICVIIPVYEHENAIGLVIDQLKLYGLPCILINDGSSEHCSRKLQQYAKIEKSWLTLYERPVNGGKGAAVMDGLLLAIDRGFSHAIQIDADGQHQLSDLNKFLTASEQSPKHLILGQPCFDASVPKQRLYGRKFTNFWIHINTLSHAIVDGMCGFRCYPLAAVEKLLQTKKLSRRMDFDIEIAVRLYWQGLDVINIPTRVQYPLDGVSHFKMLLDNYCISKIHAQLFFGMIWRIPKLIGRKLS